MSETELPAISGSPEDADETTGKVLTPAEWAEVVTLWELGKVTLVDLSAKFGISPAGLSKGLKKRGAVKGSRAKEVGDAMAKAVLKVTEEDALTAAEERQAKINETRKSHYDYAKMLASQIMGRLAKAQKDERPFESEMNNIKTLRIAAQGLATIRQERFAILDADKAVDQDELPELVIRDLTEDEITKLRNVDTEDDGLELPAELSDEVIET
jgi:hypothetical protein